MEADYVTVVVDRLIRYDAEYPLLLTFWPKPTNAAVAWSLGDS